MNCKAVVGIFLKQKVGKQKRRSLPPEHRNIKTSDYIHVFGGFVAVQGTEGVEHAAEEGALLGWFVDGGRGVLLVAH